MLGVILLLSMLCACAGEGSGESITSDSQGSLEESAVIPPPSPDRLESARAEAEQALSNAPKTDFQGMSFIITSNCEQGLFGDGSEEEPTVLARESFKRIQALSAHLNVNIISAAATHAEMTDGMKNQQSAGTVYTHLLHTEERNIGNLLYNDHIGSIQSLPFVDLSKPYYDAEFCEEMQTPTGLYALYGDACLDYDSMMAVFYNDTLAQSLGITDIEETVLGGGWTYDKMLELAKTAAASTEQNGIYGILNADSEKFFRAVYAANSLDTVDLDGKSFVLNDNKDKGDAAVEKIRDMLESGAYTAGNVEEITSEELFASGKGMFFISSLEAVARINNMPNVWGVLPIPTVSGAEHTLVHTKNTKVICYPRSATELNETGIMIESLFACSYKIIDAAYKYTYFHSYVRNEKSMDMIMYLFERERAEFVLLFEDEFPNLYKGTLGAFVRSCWNGPMYSALFEDNRAATRRSLSQIY